MRGVAATLVLATHAIGIAADTSTGWFTLRDVFNFDEFGAIGVDLFFIISGFVMAYAVADRSGVGPAAGFLGMRWVRVAPPYIIASLIMLPIAIFQNMPPTGLALFNAISFVPWLDSAEYSVPVLYLGWTLSFEVSFYLLVAITVSSGLSRKIGWLGVAMVVMVALGQLFTGAPFLVRWFTNPILLEFTLGILAYVIWKRGLLIQYKWFWACAGVVSIAALIPVAVSGDIPMAKMESIMDGSMSLDRVILWGVPTFFIFAAVLAFDWQRAGRFSRLCASLGDASYSVYLIHVPALACVTFLLRRLPYNVPADVIFLACMVVGLASGFLFFRLLERPLTAFLRGRAAKLAVRISAVLRSAD
ncbi:acyltransferase [Cryobacterium sp. PH31-O1]|nr:acyltransferase [Cryobacterium sp. PH31-O1]MDJ0338362.1 acyltransferase [Cryobacterium sp. PH31-O1]